MNDAHPTGGFAGRELVVTGGTGALGSAVVDELLAAGARVTVPVHSEDELKHFAHTHDERVDIVRDVDLTSPKGAAAVFDRFGPDRPLWGSIHTAGGFAMGPIAEGGHKTWDKMLALNATTVFRSCLGAVEAMRRSGTAGGRIVNVAAKPALEPSGGGKMVAYTASKAAVAALTQALAAELAGERIWVNAIAPSTIDTPANRQAMPDADHASWPTPADLARTIAFLASPANTSTRGGIVPVYGRA